MPYGGTTPDQDARIERCVSRLTKQGKSKESAIRICKASILKQQKRLKK